MKWWKRPNTWILIGIAVSLCILAWWLSYRKEGFQTVPNGRTMSTTNISYPFNEVFLLAPTDTLNKVNLYSVPTDIQYAKGYTYEEARQACQSFGAAFPDINKSDISGADLATPERIYRAFDLSGNWCVKAWGIDRKVYILRNGNNKCGETTNGVDSTGPIIKIGSDGTVKTDSTGVEKAFAICYAPKPPAASTGSEFVNNFQPIQYNMISQSMLNKVISGMGVDISGIDIFPKEFTADQAYYALDIPFVYNATNKNYTKYTSQTPVYYNRKYKRYEINISNPIDTSIYTAVTFGNGSSATNPSKETLKYNVLAARQYLIDNFDTVNTTISRKVDTTYSDTEADWSDTVGTDGLKAKVSKSCGLLQTVDHDYSTKLNSLKALFADVSGSVLSLIWAKNENTNIQATIFDVCANTTPLSSPACAKLATLDYDTFYSDPSHSTLSDLETLNYYRYLREQEMCTTIVNLKTVKDILGCSYTSEITDCPNLHINPDTKAISQYDSTDTTKDASGNPYYVANKQYINLDTNNVEGLKYALRDISPLFQVASYKDLLTNVLTTLSYLVRTPSLVDFSNSKMKFDQVTRAINDIQTILNY